MSDMKKWMTIVESVQPMQAVLIKPEFGGGMAQVVNHTDDLVNLDAKGTSLELPLDAVISKDGNDPFLQAQDSFQKVNIDPAVTATEHPELMRGDMVTVKHAYGTGTGDGLGVFITYSTDGKTAIVAFDGEIKELPVDNVVANTIQAQKDEFSANGDVGINSPVSKSTTQMCEPVCGCMSYDCTICFPDVSCHTTPAAVDNDDMVVTTLVDDYNEELDEIAPALLAAGELIAGRAAAGAAADAGIGFLGQNVAKTAGQSAVSALFGDSNSEVDEDTFLSHLDEICGSLQEANGEDMPDVLDNEDELDDYETGIDDLYHGKSVDDSSDNGHKVGEILDSPNNIYSMEELIDMDDDTLERLYQKALSSDAAELDGIDAVDYEEDDMYDGVDPDVADWMKRLHR